MNLEIDLTHSDIVIEISEQTTFLGIKLITSENDIWIYLDRAVVRKIKEELIKIKI